MTDLSVRTQALDITKSFIVEAPAGSGKTTLLTMRLLKLLTVVDTPEECLAITFTKKAAAEMHTRILEALHRADSPLCQQVLRRANDLGWDLLEKPFRLKIKTIDAFCLGLIQQMPLQAGLSFKPTIVEDAKSLMMRAVKHFFCDFESLDEQNVQNADVAESLEQLLSHLDNNEMRLRDLFVEMLTLRDQWLPYLYAKTDSDSLKKTLEKSLSNIISDRLETLKKEIESHIHQNRHLNWNDIPVFANLPCILPESLSEWLSLSDLCLTREDTFRKTLTAKQGIEPSSPIKGKLLECIKSMEDNDSLRQAFIRVRHCPRSFYTQSQWTILQALMHVLPILVAHLNLIFEEEGQIDFTEILMSALRALGDSENPTDLTLILDYKIKHILVDEFQDTSISQFRLLEKLTAGWSHDDGRTLFLVGDPKQSIYRFRQAEVGLFLRAKKNGINAVTLLPLQLTTNFRSTKTLVEFVNDELSKIFPKEEDTLTGAIPFVASVANESAESKSTASNEEQKSFAKILTVEDNEIAETIKNILQPLIQTSTAILVRSRNHLSDILPKLREAGILFNGVELELLNTKPVVQDLFSLTRAILDLNDRVAWLSVLRGPFVQLSLNDLYFIANANDESIPIWVTLTNGTLEPDKNTLDPSVSTKLCQFVAILETALMRRGREHISYIVSDTWQQLGGHFYLSDKNTQLAINTFFEHLTKERILPDDEDLDRMLEGLYANDEPSQYSNNELSQSSDAMQSIQVMTIHKAKGLEFDNVIVVGFNQRIQHDTDKLLTWRECVVDGKTHFIIAPIKATGEDKDTINAFLNFEAKQIADHESKRLLYVAMTRAKKKLFLVS